VSNKFAYTFRNACRSVMLVPIELKAIPVHFPAYSPYLNNSEPSAVHKMGSCDGLLLRLYF
jgi:hypothetical protein